MKFQNIIVLAPFMMIGCNYPMEGTLEITSPMTLKDSQNHIFEMIPNNHEITAKRLKSGFKIKLRDDSGKSRKIQIKTPKKVSIPAKNGNFQLSATDSDQPFDIQGTVNTEITNGPSATRSDTCKDDASSYYPGPNHTGHRDVTFHEQQTDLQISLLLKRPKTEDQLGTFYGHQASKEVILDYIGPCIFK
jgi:hypothetical protein